MSQFQIHTIESAPETAQEALKAVQQAKRFYPKSDRRISQRPNSTGNLPHCGWY